MAATPLAPFVQLSEQLRTRENELNQRLAEARRRADLAVTAARDALAEADEAYYAEGGEIVLNRSTVTVYDVAEARAIVGLLAEFPGPYKLESVRVSTVNTQGAAIDAHIIEQMRKALEEGGLVHIDGNIYDIPAAE